MGDSTSFSGLFGGADFDPKMQLTLLRTRALAIKCGLVFIHHMIHRLKFTLDATANDSTAKEKALHPKLIDFP